MALIAHLPSLGFPLLLYDDLHYVTENPFVRSGISFDNIYWAFTTGYYGNWHPITWLSLQWDATIGGGNPLAFHLTNVLLHAGATGVLAKFYYGLSRKWSVAVLAAILYGLHPMHVESVAWVSERKGLLSSFFLSLTVLAYLRFIDAPGLKPALLVMIPFVLSLLSKQMGVTIPLLLPLCHLLFGGQNKSSCLRLIHDQSYRTLYLILFMLAVSFSAIAYITQDRVGALATNEAKPIIERALQASLNYWHYLAIYVWPSPLSFNYPPPATSPSIMVTLASMLGLCALVTLAWTSRHKHPIITFAVLWFLIAFLPVIGIIQVGVQVIAMRYSDWPLVSIHLLVAWSLIKLIESLSPSAFYRSVFAAAAIGTLLVGGVLLTRLESRYWGSDELLYARAIKLAPDNPVAHSMLGRHYMEVGKNGLALKHFTESILHNPNNPVVLSNMGLLYLLEDKLPQASDVLRQALELDPDGLESRLHHGMLLVRQNRLEEAARRFRELTEEFDDAHQAWFNLGAVHLRMGIHDEAAASYRRCLELEPSQWRAWYFLGQVLENKGAWEDATAAYSQAIAQTSATELQPLRSFLRLQLLRGAGNQFEPLLLRIKDLSDDQAPYPECLMHQLIKDHKNLDDDFIRDYETLATVQTSDPFVLEVLGDASDALGRTEKAKSYWSQADACWLPNSRTVSASCRTARIDRRHAKAK